MTAFPSAPKGLARRAGAQHTPHLAGNGWRAMLRSSATGDLQGMRKLGGPLLLTALFVAVLLGVYVLHIKY
ncbi:MAG TPA: hypothetical protein VFY92_05850, partial [Hyphomicrobiaceae bacterium]|nr:hypothetical protein [Hyphomicrobiaceae bacterium]